jgi:Bacterial Ig-like domain
MYIALLGYLAPLAQASGANVENQGRNSSRLCKVNGRRLGRWSPIGSSESLRVLTRQSTFWVTSLATLLTRKQGGSAARSQKLDNLDMTVLNANQIYESGKYTANVYVDNDDYSNSTESLILDDSLFPNSVAMYWTWPSETKPSITSFAAVDYGNYADGTPATPILSSRLSDITTLTEYHGFTAAGALSGYNVIDDMFLTSVAGGDNAHAAEVEVLYHTPVNSQAWISSLTQIGSVEVSNVKWIVSEGPNERGVPDYVFSRANNQDLGAGEFNIKDMLDYLVSTGAVSGNLYFNGMAFGVETDSGSGSLHLNTYMVDYSTTATSPPVSLSLENQTGSTISGYEYTYDQALVGHADANATVEIYDGSTRLQSVTANSQGDWSYVPALSTGYYALTATETNSYGNSASASLKIALNTNALTISENITYVAGQGQNGLYTKDPDLTGWTAPDASVSLQDGANLLADLTANSAGFWSYDTTNLSTGSHDIVATAHDVYGRAAAASRSFTFE